MYVFDPDKGRRRRALIRDKMVSGWHKMGDAIDATSRDLGNRARGIVAEFRSWIKREPVSDEVLVERVRAKIGQVVSHPGSIAVTANQGQVTLSGPILAREVDELISVVSKVRGVTDKENRLEVHEQAGDVPGLQGGVPRRGGRPEFMQVNWSPGTRLILGVAGGALALYGAKRRGAFGVTVSSLGLGLLARAVTNMEMKRLIGVGGGRRAVDLQTTINIAAPVEQVYEFLSHYENYPQFMSNVLEVRESGPTRSHWKVSGPAGAPVEWEAEVTRREPNRELAWQSVPGSTVDHAGVFRVEPSDGGTRVDVQLSYHPPAGAAGHGLAKLFGSDPKTMLDEDLMRMKTLIETGPPRQNAALSRLPGREVYH